ncbi:hypothetical protein ACRCPS_31185 [Pseudomonas aeruginosa]
MSNEGAACSHQNQHAEGAGVRWCSDCGKKEPGVALSAAARQLTKPVPDNCSDRYASGWAYADWYISKGGNLNADAPGNWHEEKVNGFWDRLTAERDALAKPAN